MNRELTLDELWEQRRFLSRHIDAICQDPSLSESQKSALLHPLKSSLTKFDQAITNATPQEETK